MKSHVRGDFAEAGAGALAFSKLGMSAFCGNFAAKVGLSST
jgi:hypothetical protein